MHAQSFHPPGTSKVVAIGEMKSFSSTNSNVETFNAFKAKLKANLKKRGYSHKFINLHTSKVNFLNRSFELKPKNKVLVKRISYLSPDIPHHDPEQ